MACGLPSQMLGNDSFKWYESLYKTATLPSWKQKHYKMFGTRACIEFCSRAGDGSTIASFWSLEASCTAIVGILNTRSLRVVALKTLVRADLHLYQSSGVLILSPLSPLYRAELCRIYEQRDQIAIGTSYCGGNCTDVAASGRKPSLSLHRLCAHPQFSALLTALLCSYAFSYFSCDQFPLSSSLILSCLLSRLFLMSSCTSSPHSPHLPVNVACVPHICVCSALFMTLFPCHRKTSVFMFTGITPAHEAQQPTNASLPLHPCATTNQG